ncbi:MAG: helix-turn-helix transcriptional regulator, partial [Planctomycetes bacterium]|nr:helix-turn-helix transcriptional regulator [Planctomycetota bacterium]
PLVEFIYLCLAGREILRLTGELIERRGPVFALPEENPAVQEAASICLSLYRSEIENPYQASRLAYGFLMKLSEELLPGREGPAQPDWVIAVARFCRDHFSEEIGVDEMAAVSGYSRYHFSRLFRHATGSAPGEYLQKIRLNQAARSLTRSELSVKQIAHQSGFRDYNYFCRAFRQAYGQSPGAFQRSGLT